MPFRYGRFVVFSPAHLTLYSDTASGNWSLGGTFGFARRHVKAFVIFLSIVSPSRLAQRGHPPPSPSCSPEAQASCYVTTRDHESRNKPKPVLANVQDQMRQLLSSPAAATLAYASFSASFASFAPFVPFPAYFASFFANYMSAGSLFAYGALTGLRPQLRTLCFRHFL